MKKSRYNVHTLPGIALAAIIFLHPPMASQSAYPSDTLDFLKASERFDPDRIDTAFLEKAMIYYTNLERKYNDLRPCRSDSKLRLSARRHSDEMAAYQSLFHESPNPKNAHLSDRIRRAGLDLANTFIGENLGVDYVFAIANIPYYVRKVRGQTVYIHAESGRAIPYQTYREFAKCMVDNWMKSPGHRKNILKKNFNRIGIGIATNTYKGIRALYVTQHFMGPIISEDRH